MHRYVTAHALGCMRLHVRTGGFEWARVRAQANEKRNARLVADGKPVASIGSESKGRDAHVDANVAQLPLHVHVAEGHPIMLCKSVRDITPPRASEPPCPCPPIRWRPVPCAAMG